MKEIIFPGPKAIEVIARHKRVLATTTHDEDFSIALKRGKGIHLWDVDGKKYIDCYSQISIADIGYGHPKVWKAISHQYKELSACIATDTYIEVKVEAAEKLAEITKKSFPARDWRVCFSSSGGEANNAAVKLLIDRRPQRRKFIGFLGAFHGRLLGSALDVSSSKSVHKRDYPKALDVIHLPYPDCRHCAYEMHNYSNCRQLCIRYIEKEILGRLCDHEEINGVIIEPIQGEGGFIVPDYLAMRRLSDLCKKYDWALVVDEVQSGLGRTGKMFAIEHFGIAPDVIVLAKKLGAGVPIGAIVFPRDWDFTKAGRHSTTFGGEPIGWAAVKATLEVIEEEDLVSNAAQTGKYFLEKLREIKNKFIGDVRGLGLMIGVEFINTRGAVEDPNPAFRDAVWRECIKHGILPYAAGHPERNPILRFLPPLIVTKDDIDKIAIRFEKALKAATKRQA